MKVRRAGSEDLPAIADLEKQLFDDPWSEQALRRYVGVADSVSSTEYIAWVADDDCGVGYLVYDAVLEDGTIERLGVAPGEQRQGVGMALVERCIQHARQSGVARLWLEVAESNRAARGLYGKLGFTIRGRRKGYYAGAPPEDALIMCRDVEPQNSPERQT